MVLENICADYLERAGSQSKYEKKDGEALDRLLEAYKAGKSIFDMREEYDCLIGAIVNDYFLAGARFGIQIITDGLRGESNG